VETLGTLNKVARIGPHGGGSGLSLRARGPFLTMRGFRILASEANTEKMDRRGRTAVRSTLGDELRERLMPRCIRDKGAEGDQDTSISMIVGAAAATGFWGMAA
jgi:hypothetical protein